MKAYSKSAVDVFGLEDHVHEELGAAQVRGEGKGPCKESVEGGRGPTSAFILFMASIAMPIRASRGPGIRVGISRVPARGWLDTEGGALSAQRRPQPKASASSWRSKTTG